VTAVIALYTRVQLATSRYEKDGAIEGMLGYIIESHPGDMYEIEFSDRTTGATVALIVAHESELVPKPEKGALPIE